MRNFECALPQVSANIFGEFGGENDPALLLVLGGRPPDVSWLRELAGTKTGLAGTKVWAADSGGAVCRAAGILPERLIGDFDSIGEDDREWLVSRGAEVTKHPAEKDMTDYQLCLEAASLGGKRNVIVSGGWGGRFDHAYSNLYSALWGLEFGVRVVCLADEREVLFYVYSGESIELDFRREPAAFSLLALEPSSVVSVNGARWDLSRAPLEQRRPYAVSNTPSGNAVRIDIHEGTAGVYAVFTGPSF